MKEFETHDNFYLAECGKCSGWAFNVSCKKTGKIGVVKISKCNDEPQYTVVATALEEDCDIDERDYPTEKDALLRFLRKSFLRIDDEDPCEAFHDEFPQCPACNEDTIEDESELY